MNRPSFSLIELLTIIAIVTVLSAILFPVLAASHSASKVSNEKNLRKIAAAARNYGDDWDERIPIMINGYYHSLKNTKDGVLTIPYNEGRTDSWVMLLLPYLKDRGLYRDPRRDDTSGIWRGPALASQDPGYVATANTYRAQNQFPNYGVNYEFLSPLLIPGSKMADATPMDFAQGQCRSFFNAEKAAETVFYAVSDRGYIPTSASDNGGTLDSSRGFYGVNAPGMWAAFSASTVPYVAFSTGSWCSGDWCGDSDPKTPEKERRTNTFFSEPMLGGNNVAFLDGHVRFMKDAALAAGTDFLSSTPQGFGSKLLLGGANITDKRKYLWNLDHEYYGL